MKTVNVVAESDHSRRVFSIEVNSFEPTDVVIGLLKKSHPFVESHPDFPSFVARFLQDVERLDGKIVIRLDNVTYHAKAVDKAVFIVSVKSHSDEYREIRVRAANWPMAKAAVVTYLDTMAANYLDRAEILDIVGVDPADTPALISFH